jgi:hypothetical protein
VYPITPSSSSRSRTFFISGASTMIPRPHGTADLGMPRFRTASQFRTAEPPEGPPNTLRARPYAYRPTVTVGCLVL